MNKIKHALVLTGLAAVANFAFGLLLRFTHFGAGMPAEVQVGMPVFTFFVSAWFLLAQLLPKWE